MSDKIRVCFQVSKKTAMLSKLLKTELTSTEFDDLINSVLHRNFKKQLDKRGIDLKVASTNEDCPLCNKGSLLLRKGKSGEFLGCSRFPACKFTKTIK